MSAAVHLLGAEARRGRSSLRAPLLALGMLALIGGLWGGVVRLGWPLPFPRLSLAAFHGPLMVSGFLGTVIGLERAVELGGRWLYLGPLATGLGSLSLVLGAPGETGPLLITLGSVAFCAVSAMVFRRQTTLFATTMALGALAWLVGNGLWLAGWPVHRVVLWWVGFLVLTIAGERFELVRTVRVSRAASCVFGASVGVLLAALTLTMARPDPGARLAGAGMIAIGLWLARYDVGRRMVRQLGSDRFTALCLQGGDAWLLVAGVLAANFGDVSAGTPYDAILHSLFVGFVMTMIFGHAPIVFPAVLGVAVAYRPAFYAHLVLLHASLVLRVAGDLVLWSPGREWGGLLNAVAIVVFLANTAYGALAPRAVR